LNYLSNHLWVVIVGGTGGLGLMAIQLAKALTGAKVIVIGLHDNKLQAARKCGADAIVSHLSMSI
jgi:alcohol dehydrogenase, propanol-preferring